MNLHIKMLNRVLDNLRSLNALKPTGMELTNKQIEEYNAWLVDSIAQTLEGICVNSQGSVLWGRTQEGLIYFYLLDGIKPRFTEFE